ncbi:uncharacterized protein PHALS_09255 [Plasmopara halstedii]|uniref:Uncharacterized protein n=1 Tax=Plasmopara halstedii TaxID=4781 RepID=A0A0P1ADX9_PLAHL|nr:uncharacterized protein PHALS_09255 [Plasmopara halstedii]CEG39201.1 hypothetical protein PHALS_09255 [Plasmopara halstedii]|eukprot:XP_024575570.1 hypothetical protein PHALS_09255 [Plasmopara halstedii]
MLSAYYQCLCASSCLHKPCPLSRLRCLKLLLLTEVRKNLNDECLLRVQYISEEGCMRVQSRMMQDSVWFES